MKLFIRNFCVGAIYNFGAEAVIKTKSKLSLSRVDLILLFVLLGECSRCCHMPGLVVLPTCGKAFNNFYVCKWDLNFNGTLLLFAFAENLFKNNQVNVLTMFFLHQRLYINPIFTSSKVHIYSVELRYRVGSCQLISRYI